MLWSLGRKPYWLLLFVCGLLSILQLLLRSVAAPMTIHQRGR